MADTESAGQIDEDAVGEIPPGQPHAGSVQGGGSDILSGGGPDESGGEAAAVDTEAGTFQDFDVAIVDDDKGATGE